MLDAYAATKTNNHRFFLDQISTTPKKKEDEDIFDLFERLDRKLTELASRGIKIDAVSINA